MNETDAKAILADMLRKADNEISRWEKFRAYERAGTRNLAGNKPYGEDRLNAAVNRWTARRDALEWALSRLSNVGSDASASSPIASTGLVGCPPSVTPAMLDAAGETDWWWCPACGVPVQPEHVTFEETHDPRCGGCGKPVWPESEVDHTPNDEFRGGCKPSSGTSCCAVHSTEKEA